MSVVLQRLFYTDWSMELLFRSLYGYDLLFLSKGVRRCFELFNATTFTFLYFSPKNLTEKLFLNRNEKLSCVDSGGGATKMNSVRYHLKSSLACVLNAIWFTFDTNFQRDLSSLLHFPLHIFWIKTLQFHVTTLSDFWATYPS